MILKHYDDTPAPQCPVCGAQWNDTDHRPVKESRGWNYQKSVPAWAWTCVSCLDEDNIDG